MKGKRKFCHYYSKSQLFSRCSLCVGNGDSVASGLQVLSQASLKVYNKGELLDSGQPQQLFVLLRGCVCLHYPDSRTYLAGAPSHACWTCPTPCSLSVS